MKQRVSFWRTIHIPMKKFLLAGTVIVGFIVYALRQQSIPPAIPIANTQTTQSIDQLPSATSAGSPASDTPPSNPSGSDNSGGQMMNGQGMMGKYRDGTYTGNPADAYYGYIQVQVAVQNGQISDVQFLRYPNDRSTSIAINRQAMPYLRTEAIQAQSANVNIVSGATDSSLAFRQSMQSALSQAQ